DNIAQRWRALIQQCEEAMKTNWLERHLAPLKDNVPQFEVRRLQALRRAQQIAREAESVAETRRPTPDSERYGHEYPIATSDGLVRGRIDAVLPSDDGPVIQDF